PATVVCADIMADTLPSSNGWTTRSRAGTSSGRARKPRDPGSERERGRRSVEYQQIITGGGEDIGEEEAEGERPCGGLPLRPGAVQRSRPAAPARRLRAGAADGG